MSSDDKIDKVNEAALAVTLREEGASSRSLIELCLSFGIYFPAPTLIPLAWKQESPINETILCPVTGDTYIIGRVIGSIAKLVSCTYHAYIIPVKRLERTLLLDESTVAQCREAVELHRNTKIRENLL